MILMAGYDMPLRTIREQIASAVDLIVHTARLKDGTRKVMNITEVYGIEDDMILTQDIFEYEQTGVDENGRIVGDLRPTGERPTFMPKFAASGIDLPAGEFGIPPESPEHPVKTRVGKGRGIGIDQGTDHARRLDFGLGTTHVAGGMVYASSVGPVVPESGRLVSDLFKEQARQCMANLKSVLEREGSSLEKIVWANWALRDASEFEPFQDEWVTWFEGTAPMGQGVIMPPAHRRAGFRVSLGVIAQA
jgi:enamine deaminase RidA (YjgF/YER057c/UK114 family)